MLWIALRSATCQSVSCSPLAENGRIRTKSVEAIQTATRFVNCDVDESPSSIRHVPFQFWVCWHEKLVTRGTTQYDPAPFDPPTKVKHNGDITMKNIAEFLVKYLSSDAVGPLSNRHLAWSDSEGPMHPNSLKLARAIAQAVDFPKTGVLPRVPSNITSNPYPDFMENKYKPSYASKSPSIEAC